MINADEMGDFCFDLNIFRVFLCEMIRLSYLCSVNPINYIVMRKILFLALFMASAIALFGSCKNKSNEPEPEPQPGMQSLDYSQDANWMIKSPIAHEVDLFYIYPTSVELSCTTLVSPVDETMKANAYYSYLQNAECFSGYTNVFAPYYRQITAVGIMQCSSYKDLIEMDRNNEPWCDLEAALDYYFANINKDRPVMFASHSQGSACMHIVMDTYMKKHPELKSRIVAVYALGMCATQEFCDEVGIPFATGEEDTGCYITWNTEGPGGTKFNLPVGENSLIINPLNWKRDATYAGVDMNKGSLKANAEGVLEQVEGRADAQLDLQRGVVVCTTDTNYLPESTTFGDKSFHFEDGALYYGNMKENGKKRIAAFLGHEPK